MSEKLIKAVESHGWYYTKDSDEITSYNRTMNYGELAERLDNELEDRMELACWAFAGCSADYAMIP